jgi:MarR family 2-MHQ and catechol resistance regulon transcriptional repressor
MREHEFPHRDGRKIAFEEFNRELRQNVKAIAEIDDISGFELSSGIHMLANMFDSFLAVRDNEIGISSQRMGILMRLYMGEKMGIDGSLTPTELSRFQNVSKNTISSLIRGLEEQGLVTREIDRDDKRIFRLRITDKGRDLVKEETPKRAVFLNKLVTDLGDNEKQQLTELLFKLRKSMINQAHLGKIGCKKYHNPA